MPETKKTTLSFKEKLSAIMDSVGNIEKKGRNDFHKYDYVRDEDVVTAFRKEFIKHGLLFLPSIVSQTIHTTDKGNLADITMEIQIADVDSNEQFKLRWAGLGYDANDKSLYKAITGGIKYVLLKTFMVSTGDDPERDTAQPPARPTNVPQSAPEPATEAQKKAVKAVVKALKGEWPNDDWVNSLTKGQAGSVIEKTKQELEAREKKAALTPTDVEEVFNG